ncbi:DEAD/DEAH box helicase family protein [Crocosphaera sp. XPORK-15E]|uniref:DEAD/DEAH box helicase family protein n=1 Tax=Crocosphaera sp. XPORK-15E TaxID=3110247 RepID=UPI002B206BE0|nr:DEAD/DEAH box helicase family protein [Crocosphaera sp. XPORK-15E]MEA5533730.1 DEAD/DEAH box helicase family protein [Crocosphaera sp. XPORK-15E]
MLITWCDAISHIILDNVIIKLIISPELSDNDKRALSIATDENERDKLRQVFADKIIKDTLQNNSSETRQKLLAWMIANERLILRFAFPQHLDQVGLFHEKIGIFDFPWGDMIAFTGSANESINGHNFNYESIDVYRDWIIPDQERVVNKIEEFEDAWTGKADGLKTVGLSEKSLNFISSYAPNFNPFDDDTFKPQKIIKVSESSNKNNRWQHQEEAVKRFLEVRRGVLEMATGTGKTRTSLKILSQLDDESKIDGIIISTDGNDLLDQWSNEIQGWAIKRPKAFRILKHYGNHHQLESFINNSQRAIIVISRTKLSLLLSHIKDNLKQKIIIIHDEVHGLGSPENCKKLKHKHQNFGYCLGLSATPERQYDQEGTKFIFEEIGEVFFKFGLKEAIELGILCEFDYIPLRYQLTDADKERRNQVYRQKAARQKEGKPMTKEEVWTALSKVYKLAEEKPTIFADFVENNPNMLKSTIIFVEEKSYGNQLLNTIHKHTHRYRTYYSGEDQENLKAFAKGDIDCLITCHRVSQGIDIKRLKNVIIFSSARAKLETIQRIGRCLRTDPECPNKKAKIVDFVVEGEEEKERIGADEERYLWLTELSQIKRIYTDVYRT